MGISSMHGAQNVPQTFIIVILFVFLAAFVGLGYILNKRTPVPKGCENLKENCEGCHIVSCIHHPSKGGENA